MYVYDFRMLCICDTYRICLVNLFQESENVVANQSATINRLKNLMENMPAVGIPLTGDKAYEDPVKVLTYDL